MRSLPLTGEAQAAIAAVVHAGDRVLDATVGNGQDTLFLARLVGCEGQVFGFDVQPAALRETARRLSAAGLRDRVTLFEAGHEALPELLPRTLRRRIGAVMFNLGYLPGSNKQVITRAASTLRALDAALDWLRPDGLVSVIAYRGHAGGREEALAVQRWVRGLDTTRYSASQSAPSAVATTPVLHLLRKLPSVPIAR